MSTLIQANMHYHYTRTDTANTCLYVDTCIRVGIGLWFSNDMQTGFDISGKLPAKEAQDHTPLVPVPASQHGCSRAQRPARDKHQLDNGTGSSHQATACFRPVYLER